MDMPHDYEIEDNTQLVLRNIIEFYRILPYNLSFSELQASMQSFLLKACKSYKPTCVSGDVNHSCIFRYFNNEKTSKILQPRGSDTNVKLASGYSPFLASVMDARGLQMMLKNASALAQEIVRNLSSSHPVLSLPI